ncbi:hypothetical protein BWQ96_07027 [Gracilariopsis chorda]|uniref:Uncharacterized protein n=1 Tax=Gracilariopsis chorda TaxID=448386 RepID=A0A2V3IME6_9FLOR|nr:hypothetical protein BWQ96_07027 [Gracilariopsis chorda]|eukprot:PXF43254.1 hypothetical protein BWQ96_07027 [Gracilariopsis chorda]
MNNSMVKLCKKNLCKNFQEVASATSSPANGANAVNGGSGVDRNVNGENDVEIQETAGIKIWCYNR